MGGFSADLEAARAGDEGAVLRLLGRVDGPLRRQIRSRINGVLRRLYDSTDLHQSVVREILRHLGEFEDRGEEAFHGWVARLASDKINGKYRKALKRRGGRREITDPGLERPETGGSPLSGLVADEDIGRVRDLMARLPERYRLVLELREWEGIQHADVAELMGLPSADAAKKVYARALLRLRELWKSTWTT